MVPEDAFRYEPLINAQSTIRVLRIKPGRNTESIFCELKCVSLYEDPKHTCLSYTWGEAVAKHTIYINDRPFMIRQSLFDFLSQARRIRLRRDWLWIDAICINQDDIEERAAQVRSMGWIYSTARIVIISPGRVQDAKTVYKKLFRFALDYYLLKKQMQYFGQTSAPNTNASQEKWDILAKKYEKSLEPFMGLPYWRRVWITQEIALAKTVQVLCHDKLIPWSWFDFVIPRFGSYAGVYLGAMGCHYRKQEHESPMMTLYQLKQHPRNLFHLLRTFGQGGCKLVHDRLYALLGLVEMPPLFMVDYSRDLGAIALDAIEKFPPLLRWSEFEGMTRTDPHVFRDCVLPAFEVLQACEVETEKLFPSTILCHSCFSTLEPELKPAETLNIDTGVLADGAPGQVVRFIWSTAEYHHFDRPSSPEKRDVLPDEAFDYHIHHARYILIEQTLFDCRRCRRDILSDVRCRKKGHWIRCSEGCMPRIPRIWRHRLSASALMIILDYRYCPEPDKPHDPLP